MLVAFTFSSPLVTILTCASHTMSHCSAARRLAGVEQIRGSAAAAQTGTAAKDNQKGVLCLKSATRALRAAILEVAPVVTLRLTAGTAMRNFPAIGYVATLESAVYVKTLEDASARRPVS